MKCLMTLLFLFCSCTAIQGQSESDTTGLVNSAVNRLLEIQEEDGAWPYEGVYRVRREIPVGYRIGGSAIVCSALLSANLDESSHEKVNAAMLKSIKLILKELEDPLMEPSQENRYDVRVWGHIYALDLFCRLKDAEGFEEVKEETNAWIPKLVETLVFEEIEGGGWNYASQRSHAAFVTGPAIQALLMARDLGVEVDQAVLDRGGEVLLDSRSENGAYQYSGRGVRSTELPGSIARSALCESTLLMLGKGDMDRLQKSIDAFHEHWDELEKRRKKTGTHMPPYGVAPYYFYFGHRYAAQGIHLLPKEKRAEEIEKFQTVLLRTKDDDDTWNDRVFDRSKAYGTAMAILALRGERVLTPEIVVAEEK